MIKSNLNVIVDVLSKAEKIYTFFYIVILHLITIELHQVNTKTELEKLTKIY